MYHRNYTHSSIFKRTKSRTYPFLALIAASLGFNSIMRMPAKQTLKTDSILETIISLLGLSFTLRLSTIL